MKIKQFNADPNNHATHLPIKKAIELLNNGSALTKPGKNLDCICKIGNNYHYKGLEDKQATILNESQVSELIKSHNWVVDLF